MAALASPAAALTTKDCSAKYQAAKQAGTLNGQKWNDFRKAECGAAADAAISTVPNPVAPSAPTPPRRPLRPRRLQSRRPAPAASAAYPPGHRPEIRQELAGKARMHTCLDSYNAAKAAGTLGGTKWIEKGGGYYSACNTRLKG